SSRRLRAVGSPTRAIPICVISGPPTGLEKHRDAAEDACLRQSFFPRRMEHLGAENATPAESSLALIDDADLYMAIVGTYYGDTPDPSALSFPELEYNRAVELQLPILVFLSREEPAPDADPRLVDFRRRLRGHTLRFFDQDVHAFETDVINSLASES